MNPSLLFHIAPSERVVETHFRLVESYRLPPADSYERLDPMGTLVFAKLSQRTTHEGARRAFDNLRLAFPNWRSVYQAPTASVERLIRTTQWPEVKAPRLQAALRLIDDRRDGILDLEHLHALTDDDALAWLVHLPGVRFKTGSCVLMMSTMHRRVLPVDTGHRRVKIRLGWMSPEVSWDDAHPLLLGQMPSDWDAVEVERHHDLIKKHAQIVCTADAPMCDCCPLIDLCAYGQRCRKGVPGWTSFTQHRRKNRLGDGQLSLSLKLTAPEGPTRGAGQ